MLTLSSGTPYKPALESSLRFVNGSSGKLRLSWQDLTTLKPSETDYLASKTSLDGDTAVETLPPNLIVTIVESFTS
jgi:hypothetical protein